MAQDPSIPKLYLLGRLTEQERLSFEDRLFSDDALLEELKCEEWELADSYATKTLPNDDLPGFEQHFLASPERQQMIAMAEALHKRAVDLSANPQPLKPATISRQPPRTLWWAIGIAALLVAGVVSWSSFKIDQEIQSQKTRDQAELTAQRQRNKALEEELTASRNNYATLQQAQASRKQMAQNTVPALPSRYDQLLRPGSARGGVDVQELRLPAVRLALAVDRKQQYRQFKVTLSANDHPVWSRELTQLPPAPKPSPFEVPVSSLQPGQFLLTLEGKSGKAGWILIDTYVFEVVDK